MKDVEGKKAGKENGEGVGEEMDERREGTWASSHRRWGKGRRTRGGGNDSNENFETKEDIGREGWSFVSLLQLEFKKVSNTSWQTLILFYFAETKQL